MKPIDVLGCKIGPGEPVFVIAEAGVNHNNRQDLAREMIDVAVDAGADAVKFQTFRAERLASPEAPKAGYQLHTTDVDESQYEMLERLELAEEAHRELYSYCKQRGIHFLSTPFDKQSTDMLDRLDVPLFKVASGEVTNWPLLDYVARRGRPIILSTGMSYLGEVDLAVRTILQAGCEQLALLHCVTSYPSDPSESNLRVMQNLSQAFGVPVGFSDHTEGIEVALAAVALGACVIEKHFTLDRRLSGPDQQSSVEADELGRLIKGIRTVEQSLGDGLKKPASSEIGNRMIVRRSLAAVGPIAAGTELSIDQLICLRPATGISPVHQELVVGRTLNRDIKAGELIDWCDLD